MGKGEMLTIVSSGMEECVVCVLCGAVTDVLVDDHVDERQWYVQGEGQLCLKCAGTGFTDIGS